VGMVVMDGMISSDGQTWWQRRTRYLAGGKALEVFVSLFS